MIEDTLDMYKYKYLSQINSVEDLRKLDEANLPELCSEIRDFMVKIITKVGGHLGAGLGVVELTTALHYVFDTPKDKLVFDVGHQGYPHKILTGRKEVFHTIRQKDGISGFLRTSESEYDAFGAGHASTSISAALGIAVARDLKGENFKSIAVIGDGALTGGLAYEALNNAGFQNRDLLVILNDNNISIDENVSAFSHYFNDIYSSHQVQTWKNNIYDIMGKTGDRGDRVRKLVSRLAGGVRAIITPGMLF
jgi:1-deoxy-D-xylulose-5-phosphate synthase